MILTTQHRMRTNILLMLLIDAVAVLCASEDDISICDPESLNCGELTTGDIECDPGNAVMNGRCVKKVFLNEHCVSEDGCRAGQLNSECNSLLRICQCRPGFKMVQVGGRGSPYSCEVLLEPDSDDLEQVDKAVLAILLVMGLMFIVICVVLQMFSKASFGRENRSIFNTPNPRLMNASFTKGGRLRSESSSTEDERTDERKKRVQVKLQEPTTTG